MAIKRIEEEYKPKELKNKCKCWSKRVVASFYKDKQWYTFICVECKEKETIYIPNKWNVSISIAK